jgi:hypothetical protein
MELVVEGVKLLAKCPHCGYEQAPDKKVSQHMQCTQCRKRYDWYVPADIPLSIKEKPTIPQIEVRRETIRDVMNEPGFYTYWNDAVLNKKHVSPEGFREWQRLSGK